MYDLAIVVPARRGSSRVANKSMLPFGTSRSLIEWKLRQLSEIIDPRRIYLSSEDDEFLAIAASLGVSQHKRDRRLATGHIAPMSDVITGVVADIPYAHIAWATVVCPLMGPQEYLSAFRRYQELVIDGPHDSLLGVNAMQEFFWFKGEPLNYRADSGHVYSQDLLPVCKVTNSLFMAPRASMLDWRYFFGPAPHLEPLSRLAGVDIDHMEDYQIARALYPVYVEAQHSVNGLADRIEWPPAAGRDSA
jgi:N-acylneuraminate cytidylyltransferase